MFKTACNRLRNYSKINIILKCKKQNLPKRPPALLLYLSLQASYGSSQGWLSNKLNRIDCKQHEWPGCGW